MPRFLFATVSMLVAGNPSFGQEPVTIKDLPGWVGALAFTPGESSTLLVGTSDGTVSFVNKEDAKVSRTYKYHSDAVMGIFVPHDRAFLSVGYDHTLVYRHAVA